MTIGCGTAVAVEPDAMFRPSRYAWRRQCRNKKGVVVRWELTANRDPFGFELDVLAPNDYRWTMKCTEGTVGAPIRKVGNKDYKKFTARVKVPEIPHAPQQSTHIPARCRDQQDATGPERLQRRSLLHV